MKNSKNETIQKFTPKWILASSIFQTKGLKYPRNKKNTTSFPEITSNSKTTTDLFPETLMNSNKNSPYNPEKIVLGTNIFTQTKSLAFMQYRNNLGSENEQLKKRESSKKFKFLLSLRNQVSQNDKLTFTSKTTHSKFKFFDEFKVQMTAEDIEFEKKIDYDEKIYEENMKERKNVIETIQNFEDDVELTNALANYKYEFYKRKGFKTNNFNLSEDKNDYSLEEFSVIRQIRNTRGEAEIFRKKINDNLVKKQNYDIHNKVRDNLEIAIRNSTISLTISPKMSPTLSPSRRKELKRKYTKQASNKNFMFWLDLNKSQRILLKMKNFFAKIIKLKISLREAFENNLFSQKPFQRLNSREFIASVKEGNMKKMLEIYFLDKYLIYEFDQSNQTALHWASKRGYEKIVKFLLKNKADPNSRDIVDRNPLYYAVREKHLKIVKLLLGFGSLPWSTKNCDFNRMETLVEIKFFLKKAKMAQMAVALTPSDKKEKVWKEERKQFLSKTIKK